MAAPLVAGLLKGLLGAGARGAVAGAGRSSLMSGVRAGAKGGLRQGMRNTVRGGAFGGKGKGGGLTRRNNESAIVRSENGGLSVQGRTIQEGGALTPSMGPKSKKSSAIVKTGPVKNNVLGLLEQIKKTADGILEVEVKELDNDNKEYKETKKEKDKERKLLEAEKRDEEEEKQEAKKAKKGRARKNPVVSAAKKGIGNILGFLFDIFKDLILYKVLDWISDPKNTEKVKQLVEFIGMIPKVFSFVWDNFLGPWAKFAGQLFSGGFQIIGAFFNVVKDLITLKWLTNPREFMNTLLEIPKTLLRVIPGILGSILDALSFGVIGKIGDLVSGLFNNPLQGINLNSVKDMLGDAGNFVKGLLGNAWNGITGFFGGLFGGGKPPEPPKPPKQQAQQPATAPSTPTTTPVTPGAPPKTPGAASATSQQPTAKAKEAKSTIASLKESEEKFKNLVGNKGTGETIRFKNVGSFVSGRGLFGAGEDKYFDPSGYPLSEGEFMSTLAAQRTRLGRVSQEKEDVAVKTSTDGSMSDASGKARSNADTAGLAAIASDFSVDGAVDTFLDSKPPAGGNPYNMVVTSKMGSRSLALSPGMHMGIDIASSGGPAKTLGVPLQAFTDGTITAVGVEGGYGNYVAWTDTAGIEHFYAHMKSPSPYKAGDKVKAGTKIGEVGDTGRGTGPHLHWEASTKPGDTGMPKSAVLSRFNPLTKYAHTAPFGGSIKPAEGSVTPPAPATSPPTSSPTTPSKNLGSVPSRTGSNLNSVEQESRSLSTTPASADRTVVNNLESSRNSVNTTEGYIDSTLPTSGLWAIYSLAI